MDNVVGKNIKRIRVLKGLTQKELADMVGYTDRSSIAKVETGVVDLYLDTVKKFADVLEVSPMLLLGFYDDDIEEFLPYLAQTDEVTRNNIRKMLDMPSKKR